MMNLLRFNRCLGLGTGILSVESENFLGCFPILDFLKAFLPKIELSVYPGQRYQILHYFISFVLVAFSAPRKMSTLSLFYLPSVHLLSGLYRNAKWPFSNFLYCDLSSWSLSPPTKNFSVVGKNICRASAARLFPILLSRKPLLTYLDKTLFLRLETCDVRGSSILHKSGYHWRTRSNAGAGKAATFVTRMPTASTPVALVIFLSRSLKTLKTEPNQYSAILTEQVWPIKDLSHSKNISLY